MKNRSFIKYLAAALLGTVLWVIPSCEDEVNLKDRDDYIDPPGTARPIPSVTIVDSVRFSSAVYKVSRDHSIPLTVTVFPTNTVSKNLKWQSADTDIVTIDDNGNVNGISVGKTTITVTSASDESQSHTCEVQVIIVPIASLVVSEASLLLEPKDIFELMTVTTPPNATIQSVEWKAATILPEDPEDPELVVVTIDENGVVTAVALGEALITVTVNDAFTSACKVSVVADKKPPLPSLTGLSVNNAAVRLEWGRNVSFGLSLTYSPTNAAINDVKWEIDNQSAVTLAPGVAPNRHTATVNAVTHTGTATVTATVNGIFKATSTVEVFFVPITGITITDGKKVEVGKTLDLSMTTNPVNATILLSTGTTPTSRVTWTSGNTAIATVNASGRVTAVAPGDVTITATATGWNESAVEKMVETTATVTVTYVPLTSVALNNGKPLSIEIGASTSLTPAYTPATATIKGNEWKSSNPDIVEVKDGKITAHKLGDAVITVTTTDGNGDQKETTCTVTVTKRKA